MADITISCPGCGNQITVSEFVSAEFLVCAKCKARVPVPARTVTAPANGGLKMAAPSEPPPAPETTSPKKGKSGRPAPASNPLNGVSQYFPSSLRQHGRRRRRASTGANLLPWLVFVVLLLALAGLRFWPGVLSASDCDLLVTGGVWVLAGLQVAVVIHAFNDEAFHGVMCAIIPGYSLYYLFGQADQYYLRAIAAAFLLVFGWDATLATRKLWQETYRNISFWLEDTDYMKKNSPH